MYISLSMPIFPSPLSQPDLLSVGFAKQVNYHNPLLLHWIHPNLVKATGYRVDILLPVESISSSLKFHQVYVWTIFASFLSKDMYFCSFEFPLESLISWTASWDYLLKMLQPSWFRLSLTILKIPLFSLKNRLSAHQKSFSILNDWY